MIAEGYDLSVQCDGDHISPKRTFWVGRNRGECHRQAQKDGWRLDTKNFKAYCPACAPTSKRTTP